MFKFITLTILIATIGLGSELEDDLEDCEDELDTPPIPTVENANFANTTIETVPHLVSIGYFDGPDKHYIHWCSGAIITENWVITAAYCFDPLFRPNTSALVIFSGSADLGNTTKGSFHTVMEEKLNWSYDEKHRSNNYATDGIGLMRVSNPFQFRINRQPVPFYEGQRIKEGSHGFISGWSLNNDPKDRAAHPKVLNRFDVKIHDGNECREQRKWKVAYRGFICTVTDPANQDKNCSNDMGSPLIVGGTLVGIASAIMSPCHGREDPAIYADIASRRDWIRAVVDPMEM